MEGTRAWSRDSWESFPAKQQPVYSTSTAKVTDRLRKLPGLVGLEEIQSLRSRLAEAYHGDCFIIQGGDCAERFIDCNEQAIQSKLKILLQMGMIVGYRSHTPVVLVGRIAGQYSKPRTGMYDGDVLSFRGDSINGILPQDRKPDPNRMLRAYFFAASTLNYISRLFSNGFGSITSVADWDLGFSSDLDSQTKDLKSNISSTLEYLSSTGVGLHEPNSMLYTSHEALLLPFEAALVRESKGEVYSSSAHFLWIGNRTRQLDHAHVELLRGLENPIGIKIGHGIHVKELLSLIRTLDPSNTAGKIALISRFGIEYLDELGPIIQAVRDAKLHVIWLCDPMHGNTTSCEGVKTRSFEDITTELQESFRIHSSLGSRLHGVHMELTGEDVTECTGGFQGITEDNLHLRYTSYCDPRLNYSQALQIAYLISDMMNPSLKVV